MHKEVSKFEGLRNSQIGPSQSSFLRSMFIELLEWCEYLCRYFFFAVFYQNLENPSGQMRMVIPLTNLPIKHTTKKKKKKIGYIIHFTYYPFYPQGFWRCLLLLKEETFAVQENREIFTFRGNKLSRMTSYEKFGGNKLSR